MDMIVYKTSITSTQAFGYAVAAAGTYYYSQLNNSGSGRPDEKQGDLPLFKKIGDEEALFPSEKILKDWWYEVCIGVCGQNSRLLEISLDAWQQIFHVLSR